MTMPQRGPDEHEQGRLLSVGDVQRMDASPFNQRRIPGSLTQYKVLE
jgi:hypothetical protein